MFTYVNGEYVPEEDAKISVFDRGFRRGDAVFDATRTFAGKPFRLEMHLERLRKSLRYAEIDPEPVIPEVRTAVNEVVRLSRDEIDAAGDVLIFFYVTRGTPPHAFDLTKAPPTIVVLLLPIDFASFAELYDTGIDVGVSLMSRHFAGANDPRVKSTNRLAAVRAELKGVRSAAADGDHPDEYRSWTLIFTDDGFIAETQAANLCIVSDGRLVRPPGYHILEGISLRIVCELAPKLGLEVQERPIGLYDLINADETYLCNSAFQILPVAFIDGISLEHQERVLYAKLLHSFIEAAEFDFVAQAKEMAARAHPRA